MLFHRRTSAKKAAPDEGCLFAMKVCQKKELGKKDRREAAQARRSRLFWDSSRERRTFGLIWAAFQAHRSTWSGLFSRGSLETLLKRRQVSLTLYVMELVVALSSCTRTASTGTGPERVD